MARAFASGRGLLVATEFRLVDEKGEIRACLRMTGDGPSLVRSDEKGKPRAGLGVKRDGPGVWLFDENGTVTWHTPP